MVRHLLSTKLKSVRGTPLRAWRGEVLGRWNPREDFSYALLHAERLTRLLADVEISQILLGQAAAIPNAALVLERYLARAEPRVRFLCDEIKHTGGPLLGRLLQAGARRKRAGMSCGPSGAAARCRALVRQRRVVGALLGTVARAAWRGRPGAGPVASRPVPGPELTERVISPSTGLVRDYARFLGAAPEAYRNPPTVPAHLFPQWTFPLAARVLRGVPYDLTRILNAGCRLEMNASVPAASPLTVRARLVDVQDDGRRALLHQQIVTDTPSHSRRAGGRPLRRRARSAPRGKKNGPSGRRARDAASVPADVREVSRFYFGPRRGTDVRAADGRPQSGALGAGLCAGGRFRDAHLARIRHDGARAGWAAARPIRRRGRSPCATIDVKFTRPLVLGLASASVSTSIGRARAFLPGGCAGRATVPDRPLRGPRRARGRTHA